MKQRMACLLIGILMGAVLLGGNVSQAAEAFLKAFPSTHTFYLDGQPIEMEAYSINGNNYVKLRDIGRMVGFNVYWDNGVQIDTSSPYTGRRAICSNHRELQGYGARCWRAQRPHHP